MTEIKISMTMDENYNITLLNCNNNRKVEIDYSNKMINASDVYDLLSYTPECNYTLESNIDSFADGNEKDYFNELIELINSIVSELNNLNSNDETEEEKNSEVKEEVEEEL